MTTNDPLDQLLSSVPVPVTKPKPPEPPRRTIMHYWPNGCVKPSPKFLTEQKAKAGLTEDTALTFDEWKDAGYRIKKGAKSAFRSLLGEPMFTIEQVWRPY